MTFFKPQIWQNVVKLGKWYEECSFQLLQSDFMDCGAKARSQKVTKFLPIDFIGCLHNSVSKGQEFRFSTIFDLLCNSSGFQKSQHKSSLIQKSL